jgi:NAD(P)-dependent dehydrogenase (short-subunit alcohol dehydrogenase family)
MTHLWLMQAVEDELKQNKGSFIITSSAAGLKPGGSSMAYSVTKAGAIHLTKCLAKATAPNVRVNAVAPGMMMTEWSQGFTQEKIDTVKKGNTLQQISDIEDCARSYGEF